MAVKLWGPMLTGLAQGFQDYQQNQEDLQYTRQYRMNQLAGQQLANQSSEIQNAQKGLDLQQAQQQANFWKSAITDNGTAEGDAAAAQAVPGAPAGASGLATAAGPLAAAGDGQGIKAPPFSAAPSMAQLASLDEKYGLPSGTAYGIMSAESNGNPNAVSKKGAVGAFQVEPSTAENPGYGLKSFNPKDPDGAMGYFAKLYKMAGGDMSKALAMWNAGPAGNPNNPETQGFIPRVLKGQQQFAASHGLDQAKQQPTPADTVAARDAAGVDTPIAGYQQAAAQQGQQIQTLRGLAQRAMKQGLPQLAMQFNAQADKLQDQQLDLQKKGLDVQKDANDQTAKLAGGVKDQSSYDNFRAQLAQNPLMQTAVRGLNLTGDYELDKQKLETLADRTLTLKDQAEIADKQARLAIDQAKERREQAKVDQPKIAAAQAQAADQQRAQSLKQKGIPFAASMAATAPIGTTPQQVQQAQQKVQAANNVALAKDATGDKADRGIAGITTQLIGLLDKPNPVTTGGFTRIPGIGAAFTTFEGDRQTFEKLSNQLVSLMQASQGAAGGGRSSFTAAMYANLKTQKPNLDLSAPTNRQIALELYAGASMEQNRREFTREYLQANPDAPIQNAQMQWASYEQSLGPAFVVDTSSPTGFKPNYAGVRTMPDGRPNPSYRDYHDFFKAQ